MRSRTGCRENAELLPEYSAGKLETSRAVELERHLLTCPSCRDLASAQGALWSALDDWKDVAPSAEFDRRLYERIDGEVAWWAADYVRETNSSQFCAKVGRTFSQVRTRSRRSLNYRCTLRTSKAAPVGGKSASRAHQVFWRLRDCDRSFARATTSTARRCARAKIASATALTNHGAAAANTNATAQMGTMCRIESTI